MMRENSFLKYFMLAAGAAEIGFALWAFYYHYMCMDHAEHIHAAWLVWQGQVPYRDFFEHHNPLFWYVLAPFVAAFYKNALVLYAAREPKGRGVISERRICSLWHRFCFCKRY